jgi:hypothetical protein
MNTGLWIAQGLLAIAFGLAGIIKTFWPIERLAAMMKWPGDVPPWMTRLIGIAEGAGAIAMVLPMALDILPWLTPLAAAGLAIIQVLAIGFHARRGELFQALPANLVLLGLALFVLIGRFELF